MRSVVKTVSVGLLLLAANSVNAAGVSLGDLGAGFTLSNCRCLSGGSDI